MDQASLYWLRQWKVFIDTAKFQHTLIEPPEKINVLFPGNGFLTLYKLPEAVDRILKVGLPVDLKHPLSPNSMRLSSKDAVLLTYMPHRFITHHLSYLTMHNKTFNVSSRTCISRWRRRSIHHSMTSVLHPWALKMFLMWPSCMWWPVDAMIPCNDN